jgi:hypothetical protein
MTMPNERMRALRWGFELIELVAADDDLAADVQTRARELLSTYPRMDQIHRWVADGACHLPTSAVDALCIAARLFREVQLRDRGTAATRRALMYTLRHYPQEHEIAGWDKPARGFPLSTWLLPEDYYDRRRRS